MKTKDFNLEEALAGATVITKSGVLCKLYHIPESKTYPYLLVLKNSGEIIGWYDESRLSQYCKLLDETPLVEIYVNVHWDGEELWTEPAITVKHIAERKGAGSKTYLKTIRITNEIGGDDE